jgi:hypothetical protein
MPQPDFIFTTSPNAREENPLYRYFAKALCANLGCTTCGCDPARTLLAQIGGEQLQRDDRGRISIATNRQVKLLSHLAQVQLDVLIHNDGQLRLNHGEANYLSLNEQWFMSLGLILSICEETEADQMIATSALVEQFRVITEQDLQPFLDDIKETERSLHWRDLSLIFEYLKPQWTWTRRYINGNLSERGQYIDGLREGRWCFMRDDFRLGKKRAHWKENLDAKNVSSEDYANRMAMLDLEDEHLACEGDYQRGLKVGTWRWWNEDGTVETTDQYD